MEAFERPPAWLKVCITCDRYASMGQGHCIGETLADALDGATRSMVLAGALSLRRVPCLSGCKYPGNIALGASEKIKIRLNQLSIEDVDALVQLAEKYAASPTGNIRHQDWPLRLQGHLAAVIAPREA